MIRTLFTIFCCACAAVVLLELAGAAWMWQQGMLTADNIRETRRLFSGEEAAEKKAEEAEVETTPLASLAEVTEARAIKILDLDKRESELTVLKTMASDKANDIDVEQVAFRVQKKEFEERLAQLKAAETSLATEQARGVLLAMQPKDAVEKLMQLTIEDDVLLLKGMPEKTIAKILKEFSVSPDQIERGRKIFEAINRGEPTKPFVDEAQKKFATGLTDTSGDAAPAAVSPAEQTPAVTKPAALPNTKSADGRVRNSINSNRFN